MQAANVKQVTHTELSKKAYVPSTTAKVEVVKAPESNVDSQKQANYSRMFEAYNDCV
jgi:hypothetical protein